MSGVADVVTVDTGAMSDSTRHDTTGEGTLDPWVADWLKANPYLSQPMGEFPAELLELTRSPVGAPPTREIAKVYDTEAASVRVRIYEHDTPPTGVVVYFHGGGFCLGGLGIMDNVAREIAYHTGAAVVSVEYRLAPENPFPAGLDDCDAVTTWALVNAPHLGASSDRVVVAGESAGGNLSATVSLRQRGSGNAPLAGQVLLYPATDRSRVYPSQEQFDGIVISLAQGKWFDASYSGGRDIARDPFVSPVYADTCKGLPPALVILGGCDMLRDEGRAYAEKLRSDGVDVEEVCYAGQPHGFMNFDFPKAADAFAEVGEWVRARFAAID